VTLLVNRNAASRIECLHALVKHIDADPRLTNGFQSTSDVKVQAAGHQITQVCSLLIVDKALGRSYCPYKENPLSKEVCQLTNSADKDSTKSKESSNSVNSLEALGFLTRSSAALMELTDSGRRLSSAMVGSKEFTQLVRTGVLNYGPAFGLLFQLVNNERLLETPSRAFIGYPQTKERVQVAGRPILLPVGSQQDSNNRTRTTLLRWLVAAGCLVPLGTKETGKEPAVEFRSFLNSPRRVVAKFGLTAVGRTAVESCPKVLAPLDYVNTLKRLSLRELGQKEQRKALLRCADIVRNRRTAIALMMSNAAERGTSVSIDEILEAFKSNLDLFGIQGKVDRSVVESEVSVAFSVGVPFSRAKNGEMSPRATIDKFVLLSTATDQFMEYAARL
jgi:hypothetical protein